MTDLSPRIECPLPDSSEETITLAHGEGGRATRRLIQDRIVPLLNQGLNDCELGDSFAFTTNSPKLAFSTDSYVVSPIFFPGGDIGSLAVHGTVNDLVVAGAVPHWLSLSLVLEEGLPWQTLERVLISVAQAASRCGIRVVTGDTKVVPKGAADGLYLNTAGIGELADPAPPGPTSLKPDDAILVSGPIARHGIAVMTAREGFDLQPPPTSDSAPLHLVTAALRQAGVNVKALRDATRGGVAAVLHEWSATCGHSMLIDAESIPVTPEVRGVCELLGLDPLHVANEGTLVAAVPRHAVEAALQAMRSVAESSQASVIGEVIGQTIASVVVRRATGVDVPLDEPSGAPLPRIC